MRASCCFGTDGGGAHHQPALAVERTAGHPVAGFTRHRQALAGEHRLVQVAAALDDLAVGR
jgi:hypothetical protein